MRLNLDREFQTESVVQVAVPVGPYLSEEVELRADCRVVWNRAIPGGTYVHGFEFQDPNEETQSLVTRIFNAFSVEGKRERFRLNKVLNIAFKQDDTWIPRNACDISPEGLGLQLSYQLPEGERIPFRLYLQDRERFEAVEVSGTVTYVAEFDDGVFRIGIRFVDLETEIAVRIQNYIDDQVR